MPADDAPRIACPQCGKEYRWNQQYAGRKVRCKCGHTMRMPAEAPTAAESAAGMYDLAESGAPAGDASTCPSCSVAMPVDAVICIECGYNVQTGQRMGEPDAAPVPTRTKAPAKGASAPVPNGASDDELLDEPPASPLKNLYVPLAALAVGIALDVALVFIASSGGDGDATPMPTVEPSIGVQIGVVAVHLIFGVVLMFPAGIYCFKLFEIPLGAMGPALLKLAAVYVGPGALGAVVAAVSTVEPAGWLIAIAGSLGLAVWLFGLNVFDSIVLSLVTWLLRWWLVVLLAGRVAEAITG